MSVSVGQLISGIRGLPEETSRKMAAVIGAVVADAASLPLQWIYDDKVVAQCAFGICATNHWNYVSSTYISNYEDNV